MGNLYYWVANWNLSRAEAVQRLGGPGITADMVDCTHDALQRVLPSVHSHAIERIAGYITGTPDIRWTDIDWAQLPHDVATLRIDQSNLDLPLIASAKVVKDEEPGASSIDTAVTVARQRLRAGDDFTIYFSQSDLASVEQAVANASLPPGHIVAYQWASPTSNPNTRLPGTIYTLGEANADLSVVLKSWLPLPAPPLHPFGVAHYGGSVDLLDGKWVVTGTTGNIHLGQGGTGKWEVHPLSPEGDFWCAKLRFSRGH